MKAISTLTGIKPETLRSWERRYSIVKPSRDASGRRKYSEDDVARLSLISTLVRSGHSVGRLAELPTNELSRLAKNAEKPFTTYNGLAQETPKASEPDTHFQRLTEAIENDELPRFHFLIGAALSTHPPEKAIDHIIAPILQHIGNLWAAGQLGIAEEHAYSQVIKQHLLIAINTLRWAARGQDILFATPPDEQHELGLMMACYLAATKGFQCHYLGANLPVSEIISAAKKKSVAVVALSVIHPKSEIKCHNDILAISAGLPEPIQLWVGAKKMNLPFFELLPSQISVFSSFASFFLNLERFEAS